MTLSRGFVTAALVILFVPFLVAFLGLAALAFTSSSGSVDPAQVPAGRPYVGSTDRTGATHYWVECPPPIEAAHGDDPLCRSDGETSLRVAAIGAPICFVVLVLLVVAFVANRRRRRPGTPALPVVGETIGLDLDQMDGRVQEVVAVVRRSLSPRQQVASTVRAAWYHHGRQIVIEARADNPDAAVVAVAPEELRARVRMSATEFEIDVSPERAEPWGDLGDALRACFEGRFVEAGRRSRRFGRLELASGRVLRVGAPHLPVPWSWRRRRRFEAF